MSQITWGKACLQLNKVETLQECADAIKSMDTACPVLAGASDPTKYMKKWLNRGYMTYHLSRHNRQHLKTAGALVEDLLPLFPDSKARLLPLLKDPDKTSVKAGFRFCHEKQLLATCLSRIHYDGPVQLLSMWACFFGDPDIAGVIASMGLRWLQLNAKALKRDRTLYEQTNEITPNLAIIVSRYLKSNMYKHKS